MWELLYLFGTLVPGLGFLLGYLNSNAFPKPLSPAEEAEAMRAMAEGDMAAKNRLIEHNLRLVAHIVRKFENSGPDREDLISIGTIGLIKAINTFNPEKNIKLTTYAARCIENEVLMHLRATKNSRTEISLDDPVSADKEGNQLTLLETLGTDSGEILDAVESRDDERLLRQSLRTLSPKERYIVIRRYGLDGDDERTQREIAKELGISRSYVSRIEKKALQKLARVFEG
ncbi:MAG TPA: RNA polymerase sporulation sigma factor SigK [Candidatus Avidehalobacter gallistercoris]|uniref:RNA polymerase sigma factor n=1 Tax=Candidatus Avidehalobacter gallistercoris TaxID=2840694 RepID=A0A9D1L004_9FIRM|nr:RNA polymerase sporulation sigma factor SigK [Candidatus Avidehalobacter gallistercoris]